MPFKSFDELRAACRNLPAGSDSAATAVARRQDTLTKPQGSLGRLETIAAWLARWQGRDMPRLDQRAGHRLRRLARRHRAGRVGLPGRGDARRWWRTSPAGGAAINQLARAAGAELDVVPLEVERPTGDFTQEPAMDEADFLAAVVGRLRRGRRRTPTCSASARWASATPPPAAAICRRAVRRRRGRLGRPRHRRRRRRPAAQGRGHRARPGAPRRRARPTRWRSPPRSAAASSPRSSAPRSPPATTASRCCSTASSAPPPPRRWHSSHPAGLDHALAAHVSAEAGHRGLLEALDLRAAARSRHAARRRLRRLPRRQHRPLGAGMPRRHGELCRGRRVGGVEGPAYPGTGAPHAFVIPEPERQPRGIRDPSS